MTTKTTEFTIPIGQRQLFLDGYYVSRLENITKTMHQPEKKGAVIRDSEQYGIQIREVVKDYDSGIWKTWGTAPQDTRGLSGYWESDDGLHWNKPALGRVEYRGSKSNNLVNIDLGKDTGKYNPGTVVYDPNDPDPNRRYKCALPPHGFGVSPNGIDWTGIPLHVRNEDSYTFSLDVETGLFILLMREGGHEDRRVILSTSSDFENWTEPEMVFRTDDLDIEMAHEAIERHNDDPTLQSPEFHVPDTVNAQAYWKKTFRYESHYIGLPVMFYRSGEVSPDWEGFDHLDLSPRVRQRISKRGDWTGLHVVQLTCSRDLKTWKRLGNRRPFIGPSRLNSGAYDTQCVVTQSSPIIQGNELWFYYSGLKTYAIISEDKVDQTAGCLAVLRRDGFISLDATGSDGCVTTCPFQIPGGKLSVNVDATGGSMNVEVIDLDGKLLGRSVEITGDNPEIEVCWDIEDLTKLVGQHVSLRFNLRDSSLYSYWFSEMQ